MKYRLEYDSEIWRPIPAGFPTEQWPSEDSWVSDLVGTFEADLGDIGEDGRAAIAEFGYSAITDRLPDVTESLVFCPRIIPVIGIANVMIADIDDGDDVDLAAIASTDPRAQLEPTIESFETAHLGVGVRAAVIIDSSNDVDAAGAFTYALRSADQLVLVAATADRVSDASLMLPFTDRLVRGISLDAS